MANERIEQNNELVEKLKAQYNSYKNSYQYEMAIEVCEKLVFEYDCVDYRFELPELYNKLKLYNKTIDFINKWMSDNQLNYYLAEWPEPFIEFARACVAIGDIDFAIKKLLQAANMVTSLISSASDDDVNGKKLLLAAIKTEIGKIYYNQKNYTQAHSYFKSALEVAEFADACYFIAHMCYKGEGLKKDLPSAIAGYLYICDTPISENPKNYDESEICIVNANYEIGLIFAKEKGYINKEKAEYYLKRANKLGYSISIERIEELLSQINETNNTTVENDNISSSDGCYVATCVYGSYDCPEVWTLRRFRDNILSKSFFGRLFIKCYYAVSPTAVKVFGGYLWFHKLFKTPLDKLVIKLQNEGVENTPYNDK